MPNAGVGVLMWFCKIRQVSGRRARVPHRYYIMDKQGVMAGSELLPCFCFCLKVQLNDEVTIQT